MTGRSTPSEKGKHRSGQRLPSAPRTSAIPIALSPSTAVFRRWISPPMAKRSPLSPGVKCLLHLSTDPLQNGLPTPPKRKQSFSLLQTDPEVYNQVEVMAGGASIRV